MIKITERTNNTPSTVSVDPSPFYFPFQFRKPSKDNLLNYNHLAIMYQYHGTDGLVRRELYLGRFTGDPVTFSRYSDAERLCNVLNGRS